MSFIDEEIMTQKEYDGTAAWNNAGYTGKGIVVWNVENRNDHGKTSERRILDSAPNAKVLTTSLELVYDNKEVTLQEVTWEGKVYDTAESFVKDQGVNIVTKSVAGSTNYSTNRPDSLVLNKIKHDYNVAFFNSCGNFGTDGVKAAFAPDVAMYVGACFINGKGELEMASYSSLGKEDLVDFSDFTGVWTGTSFASPYLAGKAALLKQRYGKDMTHEQIRTYFKLCAKDIETQYDKETTNQYDRWSGWGLVILPPLDKKLITLTIGNKNYKIDGKSYTTDSAPVLIEQRTMVPVRLVAEALGCTVHWITGKNQVSITRDDIDILMTIGSNLYQVNGKTVTFDAAPVIRSGRTLVPIRFVSEALGAKVGWVKGENRVLILS